MTKVFCMLQPGYLLEPMFVLAACVLLVMTLLYWYKTCCIRCSVYVYNSIQLIRQMHLEGLTQTCAALAYAKQSLMTSIGVLLPDSCQPCTLILHRSVLICSACQSAVKLETHCYSASCCMQKRRSWSTCHKAFKMLQQDSSFLCLKINHPACYTCSSCY